MYQFKDHLGNVRLSYKDADKNGSISQSEIVQEKNYYPFGLTHKGYNDTYRGRNHQYGFNGIELEENLSLNLYEMDLRKYDPAIARWTGIDPVRHHSMSTYTAFDNNPVFYVDPSGADAWETAGAYHYTGEDAEKAFKILKNRANRTDPKKKKKATVSAGDLVSEGVARDNEGEFDNRTPNWIRYGNFGNYKSNYEGDLAQYNEENGTNYTNNNLAGQYYYRNFYAPERSEMLAGMDQATGEAAEYVSYILPIGVGVGTGVKGAMALGKFGKYLKTTYQIINKGITKSKTGKMMFSIGFRNKITNSMLRLERHSFNTSLGKPLFTTHVNYGKFGKKHYFFNVFKRNRTTDFSKDYLFKSGKVKF